MFSTLRSRLWLSYALLLVGALFLTAIILILYLARSPVLYRQTFSRLEVVQEMLLTAHPDLTSLPAARIESILQDTDKTYNVRLAVYSPDRALVADSRAGSSAGFSALRRALLNRTNVLLRDKNGAFWIIHISRQADGSILLIGVPRPRLALFAILTSEVFPPFLAAGLAAMLLSLLVALGLARWIANPLQSLAAATHQMPHPDARPVDPKGPQEVQELTQAFNAMTSRVQASQRSQREFVANVSHELKTPITSIQGFAQALLDGTADTDEARQHAAGVILEEAGRMHRMVLDLLDLARMDSGTLDLQWTSVDLSALLSSIAEKFSPQAAASGVTIHVEAAGLPPVTADGDRLAQVFTNLVDNALKYTPRGGSITLRGSTVSDPPGVCVEVVDSGTGIPPEAVGRIFDRFYQADPSRSGGGKRGAGLGLAIVKEIVAAHGGTISVRSQPGEGTVFTVNLPLHSAQAPTLVSERKH